MIPLLLAVSVAVAAPTPYPMADAGITLNLAPGWAMTRWSDWDFKAKTADGTLQMKVWTTPFQVPITETSVKAWAEMYKSDMKEEGFDSAEVQSATVETVAGRPTGHVRLLLRSKVNGANIKVVAHVLAFEGAGQVIHAYALGLDRFEGRAYKSLTDLFTGLSVEKPPLALPGQQISSTAGYEATLPEGWRAPLPEEMETVLPLTAKLGQEMLTPDKCWVAIRPPPFGDPDLIMACKASMYLGPVDEYSFEGAEPEVHEKFFGKSPVPVPMAESVPVGDRVGFYFSPPDAKVRLAVTPYESVSVMMTWGMANQMEVADLDTAMKAALASTKFTGPDGGKPKIGADRWAAYYLRYRTFSPVVLGPFLLLIGAVFGLRAMLKKKPTPAE